MKTIAKILIALSILIISLHSIAVASGGPGPNQITYKVQILGQPPHIPNLNLTLLIGITDENNRLVAPYQQFKKGTYAYYFYENGPVKGTRVAHMINVNRGPTQLYYFYCAPNSQSGSFAPGQTYIFDLYPVVTPIH